MHETSEGKSHSIMHERNQCHLMTEPDWHDSSVGSSLPTQWRKLTLQPCGLIHIHQNQSREVKTNGLKWMFMNVTIP